MQHPKGELKQIVIRNNTLVDLPDPPLDQFAHYETDTEQGSSGSPVFNDEWEVIALHHSGVPRTNADGQILDRNGKVWPPNGNPDDIDWISNEGIRTSRLVAFIKGAAVRAHEKVLQDEFIAISSGNIAVVPIKAPGRRCQGPSQAHPIEAGAVSGAAPAPWRLGSRSGGGAPARDRLAHHPADHQHRPRIAAGHTSRRSMSEAMAAAADEAGLEASVQPDPDYSDRPGFDPRFLGFEAPLPTLMPEVRDLALPASDGIELKYHHYSVIMNAERKLAFVSAVNLDEGRRIPAPPRGRDRWFFDPRIDRRRAAR